MNPGGWIMLTLSVGMVLSLVTFCLYKVLTSSDPDMDDEIRGPLDIDTKDKDT